MNRVKIRAPRAHTTLAATAGLAAGALALIAFWPTPVDRDAHGTILAALAWAHAAGAPSWVSYSLVEFTANIALFIPVGAIVVAAVGTRRWPLGVIAGFLGSVTIELGQLLFLPHRVASIYDVVANTVGAAVGTLLFLAGTVLSSNKPVLDAS